MCHSYRLLACFSLIAGLVASAPVHAQTTPTAFENQVGQACSKGSSSTDFDTLTQCTSTGATAGTFQKAPLFVGAVTSPPYATTTCDANKAGMIQYTASAMQYCNGTAWASFGASALGTTATATSPSRSGDAGTGLFSDTATTIAVAAGGTERLRVTSTGITVFGNVDVFSYSDLNHYSIQGDKILHHGGNDQTSIGVGRYTLYNHVPAGLMDANYNTAIGSSALFNTTTGDANVAVGSRAGQNITTGSNNTVIGFQSGETLTTGNNNILIGSFVNVPAATTSDWMNLGGAIVADLTLGSVAIGAAAVTTGSSFDLSARTDSMILPKGEAALRPVAPVEGMVRYNTDTQNMEVYQGSSPDWVTVGPSTLGSAASSNNPHAAGDVNTGLFSDTANTVSIATAGVERVRIGVNGAVTIGPAAAATGSILDMSTGTGQALSSIILPGDTTANRPVTGIAGMVRYNTTTEDFEGFKGSAWASLSAPASGTNAQSMKAGWPDAIYCVDTSSRVRVLYIASMPNATGKILYYNPYDSGTSVRLGYNSDGTYDSGSAANMTGFDCLTNTWSIAQLIANGRAFNTANGQAGGTAEMQYGTAAAPGLYFTDDNNTGFYRPAADTLGFATGGVERLRITATGNLSIGGADPTAGAVLDLAAATGTARSSMIVPNDTTANRPTTGVAGMFRYNTTDNVFEGYTGSSWRSFHSDSGVNAQSIVAGWPDAIVCDGTYHLILYASSMPGSSNLHIYRLVNMSSDYHISFTTSGAYDSNANLTGYDCISKSIAQLVAGGMAFNIANGGGGANTMVSGTAGAPGLYFEADTGTNTGLYRPAEDVLGFATGGVERIRVDASGNVGIGTTAPNAKLHVVGGSGTNVNPSLTYGSQSGVVLNTADADLAMGVITASPWTYWLQARGSGSTAIPMALNPLGGNVGIGTTAPGAKLEVKAAASGTPFQVINSDYVSGSVGNALGLGFGAATGNTYAAISAGKTGWTAWSDLVLQSGGGNVGIGTTAPSSTLHVKGTNQAVGVLETTTDDNAQLRFKGVSGLRWAIGNKVTDGGTGLAFDIYDLVNSQGRLRIDSAGNVGIGTTSPGQKLTVAGTIESTSGGVKFPDGTTQVTAALGGGLYNVTAFVSSGTWTKPSGVTRIKVTVTGGGGGGGGDTGSCTPGGGGAGGTAIRFLDVTAISSVSVTVGAAGTGNTGHGAGTAGGDSSFGTYGTGYGGGAGSSANTAGTGGLSTAGTVGIPGGNGGLGSCSGSHSKVVDGGSSIWGSAPAYGAGGKGTQNGAQGIVYIEEYK